MNEVMDRKKKKGRRIEVDGYFIAKEGRSSHLVEQIK